MKKWRDDLNALSWRQEVERKKKNFFWTCFYVVTYAEVETEDLIKKL